MKTVRCLFALATVGSVQVAAVFAKVPTQRTVDCFRSAPPERIDIVNPCSQIENLNSLDVVTGACASPVQFGETIAILNTGADTSAGAGSTDARWSVSNNNAFLVENHARWLKNNDTSWWISYIASGRSTGAPSKYFDYTTTVEVPLDVDAALVVLEGRWVSDNQGVDIYVNDVAVGATNQRGNFNGAMVPFPFTAGLGLFQSGSNKVTFKIFNAGSTANPTALRVEGRVVALRSTEEATCTGTITRTWTRSRECDKEPATPFQHQQVITVTGSGTCLSPPELGSGEVPLVSDFEDPDQRCGLNHHCHQNAICCSRETATAGSNVCTSGSGLGGQCVCNSGFTGDGIDCQSNDQRGICGDNDIFFYETPSGSTANGNYQLTFDYDEANFLQTGETFNSLTITVGTCVFSYGTDTLNSAPNSCSPAVTSAGTNADYTTTSNWVPSWNPVSPDDGRVGGSCKTVTFSTTLNNLVENCGFTKGSTDFAEDVSNKDLTVLNGLVKYHTSTQKINPRGPVVNHRCYQRSTTLAIKMGTTVTVSSKALQVFGFAINGFQVTETSFDAAARDLTEGTGEDLTTTFITSVQWPYVLRSSHFSITPAPGTAWKQQLTSSSSTALGAGSAHDGIATSAATPFAGIKSHAQELVLEVSRNDCTEEEGTVCKQVWEVVVAREEACSAISPLELDASFNADFDIGCRAAFTGTCVTPSQGATAAIVTSKAGDDQLGNGFERYVTGFTTNNYVFGSAEKVTHAYAVEACADKGGLAMPANAQQNAALLAFIATFHDLNTAHAWLGAEDTRTEGAWLNSGSLADYVNWERNEPNSYSGWEEDCIEIYEFNGKWNDVRCEGSGEKLAVCQGVPGNDVDFDQSNLNRVAWSTDSDNYCTRVLDEIPLEGSIAVYDTADYNQVQDQFVFGSTAFVKVMVHGRAEIASVFAEKIQLDHTRGGGGVDAGSTQYLYSRVIDDNVDNVEQEDSSLAVTNELHRFDDAEKTANEKLNDAAVIFNFVWNEHTSPAGSNNEDAATTTTISVDVRVQFAAAISNRRMLLQAAPAPATRQQTVVGVAPAQTVAQADEVVGSATQTTASAFAALMLGTCAVF
jgi:hypothetical protein